jgi:hypothetical protein
MSDKPLSRRTLRPRRSGERTIRHAAPAVAALGLKPSLASC